jgi:hypothetical protein
MEALALVYREVDRLFVAVNLRCDRVAHAFGCGAFGYFLCLAMERSLLSRQGLKRIKMEKVIEYALMAIVSLSGWLVAIGRRAMVAAIMEKAGSRFVSKEMYDKELQNVRESLRVIETKIDKLMEL